MQAPVAVLLVDDDQAFAYHTAAGLADGDGRLEVDTAHDAEAAIDALEANAYDCVVAEYDLPDAPGLELLDVLRERTPELPVILHTGRGSEAVAAAAIDRGVAGYLPKEDAAIADLADQIIAAVEATRSASDSPLEHFIDERTDDGLLVVNEDWRYTYANEAAAQLVDRAVDDLVGERVWDAFDGLEESSFSDALRTAMETRQPRTLEARFTPLETTFDVSVAPQDDGLSIVFRDVTDRQRRLRTLRRLHDTAADLFKEPDPTRAAQLCVEAIADVIEQPLNGVWLARGDRLEPVAAAGEDRMDVGPPVFTKGDSLAWQVFEAGESRRIDDVADEPDAHNPDSRIRSELIVPVGRHGVIIVSSLEPAAFTDEDLTVIELVAFHLEASLERAEHERRLQRERNRFEAAFDTVPEPAVHVILDGTEPIIHRVNEAFVETFGVEADAAIGRSVDELVVPTEASDDPAHLNEAVRTNERFEAEIVRETADGERPFLFTAKQMPSHDEDAPTEVVATYVDLSEQAKRERELARQNERLEQFTDVLAHDVPNHLSVAAGHLDLAEETGDLSHLERVEGAHDRIETLLSDMRALVETGSPIETIEPVQLSAIVRSCWDACCNQDDPQSLDVAVDGRLLADRTRLTQLLENLFWNACDHAGEDITVTVALEGDALVVEDDGSGISEDIRDSVFETGYTTAADGTGFGLAIVREIAAAHGWGVELTDSDAGGARFVFSGVDIVDRHDA